MDRRGKLLPEHMVRQIRKLRRSGNSIREVARITGVSPATVQKYLRPPWILTNDTLEK